MAFTAGSVLSRAATLLMDASYVRWPLVELLGYLNDALTEIQVKAPEACATVAVLSLVSGAVQTLPAGYNTILRANCNVTGSGPYVRGAAITPCQRTMLDAQIPGWQQTSIVPFTPVVAHLMDDVQVPRSFFVFPGNDGTGKIEVFASLVLTPIATPGSPTVIGSYTANVPVEDIYQNAVVDYVLYKAKQKDINVPGAKEAVTGHYTQFANAFGIRLTNELRAHPRTKE